MAHHDISHMAAYQADFLKHIYSVYSRCLKSDYYRTHIEQPKVMGGL